MKTLPNQFHCSGALTHIKVQCCGVLKFYEKISCIINYVCRYLPYEKALFHDNRVGNFSFSTSFGSFGGKSREMGREREAAGATIRT